MVMPMVLRFSRGPAVAGVGAPAARRRQVVALSARSVRYWARGPVGGAAAVRCAPRVVSASRVQYLECPCRHPRALRCPPVVGPRRCVVRRALHPAVPRWRGPCSVLGAPGIAASRRGRRRRRVGRRPPGFGSPGVATQSRRPPRRRVAAHATGACWRPSASSCWCACWCAQAARGRRHVMAVASAGDPRVAPRLAGRRRARRCGVGVLLVVVVCRRCAHRRRRAAPFVAGATAPRSTSCRRLRSLRHRLGTHRCRVVMRGWGVARW